MVRHWRAVTRFLGKPVRLAAETTHDLITTAFPGDCRVCAGPLLRASAVPVCDACRAALVPRADMGCRRCGDALPYAHPEDRSAQATECLACRLAQPAFARAVSFGDYQDTLRELIHLLKYERMPALARTVGGSLAQAIRTLRDDGASDLLVVAVPLFAATERRRGYNQARLLSDEALRALARTEPDWQLEPAHGALVRARQTAAQFELEPRARRRNLEGAFAVPAGWAEQLQGREVLVIDDILTTGATARECARVLRRAGASRVWVATVARAGWAERPTHQPRVEDTVARWGVDDSETVQQGR